MSDPSDNDSKYKEPARRRSLHPRPEQIRDPLFDADPFFDPRDVVQVKYEMLRTVRVEGRRVSRAAADFGVSRPTFYEARAAFERAGLPGLLPAKKGPRRAHKLSGVVMSFVNDQLEDEGSLTMTALAKRVHERFGVTVHPRSIGRALERRAKMKL